jgi:2-amino-4-hydroxy-6-hydroxymethyldihydropteridine diphosphokinase
VNHRAAIGLGANLGDAAATVTRALRELERLGVLLRRSALYRTRPWGKADQPDFVNAAALLETALSPRELLVALQAIEAALGRVAGERWGPRAIDLDLLVYDDASVDEPGLRVPHPHLRERAFVLVPLAEIDPAYAPLRDALPPGERAGVERLEDSGIAPS